MIGPAFLPRADTALARPVIWDDLIVAVRGCVAIERRLRRPRRLLAFVRAAVGWCRCVWPHPLAAGVGLLLCAQRIAPVIYVPIDS